MRRIALLLLILCVACQESQRVGLVGDSLVDGGTDESVDDDSAMRDSFHNTEQDGTADEMPDTVPDSVVDDTQMGKPDMDTDSGTATVTDVEHKPDDDIEDDTGHDTVSDADTDTVMDTVPDTAMDTVPDSEADTVPDTVPDSEADTVPDTVPGSEADTVPDTVPDSEADTVPDTVPDSESDTAEDTGENSDTDTGTDEGKCDGVEDDGVWCDPETGIIWQAPADGERRSYSATMRYCDELVVGDMEDWRLPTYEELKSLATEEQKTECYWNEDVWGLECFPFYWSDANAAMDKVKDPLCMIYSRVFKFDIAMEQVLMVCDGQGYVAAVLCVHDQVTE